jgi:hypothetical protein
MNRRWEIFQRVRDVLAGKERASRRAQTKKGWVSETQPRTEQDPDAASTSDNSQIRLAQLLAQADPDLARIVAAWPTLPPPIRRALQALIETQGQPNRSQQTRLR